MCVCVCVCVCVRVCVRDCVCHIYSYRLLFSSNMILLRNSAIQNVMHIIYEIPSQGWSLCTCRQTRLTRPAIGTWIRLYGSYMLKMYGKHMRQT